MNTLPYAKAAVATVSAGLLAVQTTIKMPDSARSWLTVAVAILAAVAVYLIPNSPGQPTGPTPATPTTPATPAAQEPPVARAPGPPDG